MKYTGIVRKLDPLGRVTLPIETRRRLDLKQDDEVEVFVDGDQVILKKYQPGCILCEGLAGVHYFRGKLVCDKCASELSAQKVV